MRIPKINRAMAKTPESVRDKLISISPKPADRDKYQVPVKRDFDVKALRELAERLNPTSIVITSGGKATAVNGNAPLEKRIPEDCSRLDMYWHSENGVYLGMIAFLYDRKGYMLWFTNYN